jgi:hypothetical protein
VHPNGKHSHSIVYIDPEFKDVTELVAAHKAALDAAIAEARQPLVDALNEICNELGAAWAKGVRDRAFKLAKVKEGK